MFSAFIGSLILLCNQIPLGLGGLLAFIILVAWFITASRAFYETDFSAGTEETVALAAAEGGENAAAATPPAPRQQYLDSLKATLTVLVVLHHTVGAFAGGGSLGLSVGNFRNALQPFLRAFQVLQQSYFMSLFFFISAYFSPASVERKGVLPFLKDRFTRLGMPFLPFVLLAGPLALLPVQYITSGAMTYSLYTGPLWFVLWLGIFHYGYATVAEAGGLGRFLQLPLPSPFILLLAGLGLGTLQGLQLLFFPGFPLMPISFGSLPFDIAFYVGGVAARRNRWLDAPFPSALLICARTYTLLFCTGVFAYYYWVYAGGGGMFLLNTNPCNAPAARGDVTGSAIGGLLALAALSGVYTFSMSITLLDLFQRLCAGTPSAPAQFLADNAYTAYIIHPVIVLPLTAAFVAVVRSQGGVPLNQWESSIDSYSCTVSGGGASEEYSLLLGMAILSLLSLVGTYALAPLVRSIPGAKQALG